MKVVEYARSFIGTMYLWGGCSPLGWDCSGVIQEILAYAGVDPVGDQTAQTLYNHFLITGDTERTGAGALVFYGRSKSAITHVAMMTSDYTVFELGGGDHTCTDISVSAKKAAFGRERPLNKRKDIQAIIMPNYPNWTKESA